MTITRKTDFPKYIYVYSPQDREPYNTLEHDLYYLQIRIITMVIATPDGV